MRYFFAVQAALLSICWVFGTIDDPNTLAKQLLIVCSHNAVIGHWFEKSSESVFIGFPHFGPLSREVPAIRTLARFWSWEMIAIRAGNALRPFYIPDLWNSVCTLIIPQTAVFAPVALGDVLSKDYFPNPISYASVNGFPALTLLMYHNTYAMIKRVKSPGDWALLWVDPREKMNLFSPALALGVLPFACIAVYKTFQSFLGWTHPRQFPPNGKTFFGLMAGCWMPMQGWMIYDGWEFATQFKILYGCTSLMAIWWVNVMGGVDLWIEEPLGLPGRQLAFTPTWIVGHGVYFLQWALNPNDYCLRLQFFMYYMPQQVYLNHYFRTNCCKDWGTQLPIFCSYVMFTWTTWTECFKLGQDIEQVGMAQIGTEIFKDCPLHFTPMQLSVFCLWCTMIYFSPSAEGRWMLYSSLGPLNWMGLI